MKNIFSASGGAISFGLEMVIGLMILLLQGQPITQPALPPTLASNLACEEAAPVKRAISHHLQEQEE